MAENNKHDRDGEEDLSHQRKQKKQKLTTDQQSGVAEEGISTDIDNQTKQSPVESQQNETPNKEELFAMLLWFFVAVMLSYFQLYYHALTVCVYWTLSLSYENDDVGFVNEFEKVEAYGTRFFKNAGYCIRKADNEPFIYIRILKSEWSARKQLHVNYVMNNKPLVEARGIFKQNCPTYRYLLFRESAFFTERLDLTNDTDNLFELVKKAIESLTITFKHGMLDRLNENMIFVTDNNQVVFFDHPFLLVDGHRAKFHHINATRDDAAKLDQLALIGRIARYQQQDRSRYANDTDVNVTDFSYTVTSLIAKRWYPYLAERMLEYMNDYLQIAYLGAYAYESRSNNPRFNTLLHRISVRNRFQEIEPYLRHFNANAPNRNEASTKALRAFWWHLWDQGTQQRLTDLNVNMEEMTVEELAEKYIRRVKFFKYALVETYHDRLDHVSLYARR